MGEGRKVKALQKSVVAVSALEPEIEKLSDDKLRAKTDEFRERLAEGETLDDILQESFAVVREASRRTLEMRPFDVQVMGGIVLHQGKIAEMKTGEGKTLAATMPVYLNALSGKGVHVVTVNDYLARRDAQWMGQIYEFLGLTVGLIQDGHSFEERKVAYAADITYGTNTQFGFDYLRDNIATSVDHLVQREPNYAIVDEVDSILIDEARTPLIISGMPEQAADTYYRFAKIMPRLKEGEDYEVDEKKRQVAPTEAGVEKVERFLGAENLYDDVNTNLVNHLNQALRAHALYHKDIEYIVRDGRVFIVDEFTGRVLEGRRYSEGLHQAIEAKEGVKIEEENQTVATITIQNYFRQYEKLAGMTGTASTEADEFMHIYKMAVVSIPTHKDMIGEDKDDLVYKSKNAKYNAVVDDIVERYREGQPVLVGTVSVEVSEHLSGLLKRRGIGHEVLNAKQHEREAEIVAHAGERGAVTIATNMAGRGTDIKLGGGVPEVGGLYVLGTGRHESRRIDNQLRGRSGRQGDPGESRFFLSAEDDLVRLFAGDRIYRILERFKLPDDQPMEASILSKQIENAQKKVEEQNFVARKNVLKYDDVMNIQREKIYAQRRQVLEGEDLSEQIGEWIDELVEAIVLQHTESEFQEEWDLEGLLTDLESLYDTKIETVDELREAADREELIGDVLDDAHDAYEHKVEQFGPELMREIERFLVLQVVDARWREHLDAMEYLREGIHLRAMAQKDPLVEYTSEGHLMFEELGQTIREEVLRYLFHVELEPAEAEQLQAADGAGADGGLVYEHESLAGADAIAAAGAGAGDGVAAAAAVGAAGATQPHPQPQPT